MTINVGARPFFFRFCNEINQHNVDHLLRLIGEATNRNATDVHVSFSSTGGFIDAGVAFYNALRAMPVLTAFYNTGTVHSAATIAFLGAQQRYASTNSNFLIHPVETDAVRMNVSKLRAALVEAQANEDRIDRIIADRTAIPADLVTARKLGDTYITPQQALEFGVIQQIADFVLPPGHAWQ